MCGIGGVLQWGGAVEPPVLEALAASLGELQAHRGPDGHGVWSDGAGVALAHRRLSVIELSPLGAQPMSDPAGRFVLTYNGEIYNHRELRRDLEARGQSFRSRSDTEVLLAGWAHWGRAVLERIDGMFAFAIYDVRERALTLARDRAGEKPLYYAHDGSRLLFSSELKPLVRQPGMRPALDPYGVFQYCALRYVPAPFTIFRGVSQVEPGSTLTFARDGSVRRSAFFAFDRLPLETARPEELPHAVEDALIESIRRRLEASDVPVGAFLSSGIDSSLVCTLAATVLERPLQTFCAGFDAPEHDETGDAERIARHLGAEHRSYTLSTDDLLGVVRRFGECLDEPNGDRSCVPVYLLAREMRKAVTVAISGDGGDELFCGYGRYPHFSRLRRELAPGGARRTLEAYFDRALAVYGLGPAREAFPEEYPAWQERFLDLHMPVFMRAGLSDAQRLSVLDFNTYLPGAVLAKVDRMSMRHALEVRTPFFSPQVLALAASLAPTQCEQDGMLKPVLKSILSWHLPPELISAGKKGFGMPPQFFEANAALFRDLYAGAREVLAATRFFTEREHAFEILAREAGRNTNSLWAFTALGLWSESLGFPV